MTDLLKSTHAALADSIASQLHASIASQGYASLCVSGGTSPIPLFQILSKHDVAWHLVQISLVDERWVAKEHRDRNEGLLRQYLLQNRAQEASFISLYLPDESMDQAVTRLHSIGIRPDVCILGMGEDGHTASLFPDAPEISDALSTSASDYVITHPQHAPHPRIGMSLPQILRSRKIYVAIAGDNKRDIWHTAVAHPNDVRWPISYVLAQHSQVQTYDII